MRTDGKVNYTLETAGKERAWSRGEGLGGGTGPQPSRGGTKDVGAKRVKGRC